VTRSADAPDLERLIAVCLEVYEGQGPAAVDAILRAHPDLSDRVRERLDVLGRLGLVGEPPAEARPERIGDYEIAGVLGRGGMGVVYEALQRAPRRSVALKVLRAMPGEASRGRFRHEAQLLARLQHPGIAQVYQVGEAAVGGLTVPFFAMELVRGAPIDAYARDAGLDVRRRLELVAGVADAVHHAHQKGVVHRDLKPANVLVDEHGRPRVLDFGIARAIDPDLELETLRTEVGELVGTLAYMSPEQAGGEPAQVDSRTDVYSLGVLAYELLSGRLPCPVDGRPVLAVLQAIRDADPPPLSTFDRALRGDVETIVAKALEKDKERRYSSAHELAADLRRFLANEPIAARPATAAYQLAKFARRHRALVGGAAAVVLVLALGLAGTLAGLVRAARERDDAERRFQHANVVLEFQKRMFATADPRREGVRVEDLLDRAVLLLEEQRAPLEDAALRLMLGEAYEGLGLYAKADPLIAAAAATFERELGLEDLQTLAARSRLAALYAHPMVRLDDAERTIAGVAQAARRAHGPTHDVTLSARLVEATIAFERGRNVDAVGIAREVLALGGPERQQWVAAKKLLSRALQALGEIEEAIAVAREVHTLILERRGRDHPDTWSAMDTLGNMLLAEGRLEEGCALVDELLELRREHLGQAHPDTLNALSNAALGRYQRGDFARSTELLREVLAELEELYPPGHPERLATLNTLGSAYVMLGRSADAEPILAEVVARTRELRGPEHQDTLVSMTNHALALSKLRCFDEAAELYLEVVDVQRRVLGDDDAQTLIALFNMGALCIQTQRYEEADVYLAEAAERGRAALGPDHHAVGQFLKGYGDNLTYLGRYAEAEATLLEARAWMERTQPDFERHPAYRNLLQGIERLYTRWNRPDDAAAYRALLEGSG